MERAIVKRVTVKVNGQMARKRVQKVSAASDWRDRMKQARQDIPDGIGQLDVIEYVVMQNPELDRLTYATRWHRAWHSRVADPEITQAVESAAEYFKTQQNNLSKRLSRQKLSTPKV